MCSTGNNRVNLGACYWANHKHKAYTVWCKLCICFHNTKYSIFFALAILCRMANISYPAALFLHLDEQKYTVKWYNACLTVPFNWKGQKLHNSQMKGFRQGWHYKLLPLKVLAHCSATFFILQLIIGGKIDHFSLCLRLPTYFIYSFSSSEQTDRERWCCVSLILVMTYNSMVFYLLLSPNRHRPDPFQTEQWL